MTRTRAGLLIVLASVGTYANSLGNGFAMDDVGIIVANPAVTALDVGRTMLGPYWPVAREGAGLYRPVVTTSFALEWRLFGGDPLGFHAVSVLAHTIVCLLVLALLWRVASPWAALLGALVFAVHPVHVEAVANVVGRSELYAASAVLGACLLFMRGDVWGGPGRERRLAAICLLYLVGLGSKESAVVLPGLLVVVELLRTSPLPLAERVRRGLPVYASLVAVLGGYLAVRTSVLGTVAGEVAAPWLRDATGAERLLVALHVWPELLRLMLFPLDLASDYAPGVLRLPVRVDGAVLAGALVLLGLVVLGWIARRREPRSTAGIAWLVVAILPASNLLFAAGLIMAERTLYLPSVGLSIVLAGLASRVEERATPGLQLAAAAAGATACVLLATRSVLRNPTWLDSATVVATLADEHPESYVVRRAHAAALVRSGDDGAAAEAYEEALALAPMLYGLRVEVGEFHGSRARYTRAERELLEAVRLRPDQAEAYMLLSEYMIRQGRGLEGHRIALTGLERAGPRRELFALLSESYVMKGDLEAATRARLAALGQAPDAAADWARLAQLYEAMERSADAEDARRRAARAGGEGGARAVQPPA